MEYQYYRKSKPKIKTWLNKMMRRRGTVVTLIIAVPVLSFMLFSKRGIIERISLSIEKNNKTRSLQHEEQKRDNLQKKLQELDSNPKAIEKVAREKYNLIREGETLYRVKREN